LNSIGRKNSENCKNSGKLDAGGVAYCSEEVGITESKRQLVEECQKKRRYCVVLEELFDVEIVKTEV